MVTKTNLVERAEQESSLLVYVNGALVPQEDAVISVFDSGLNFGDGVFEGIRVYDGRVFRLVEHVERLFESATAFSLTIPFSPQGLIDEILSWLGKNNIRDNFHFRPIVTRGRRFPPRLDPTFAGDSPTVLFVGGPINPSSSQGLKVIVSSYRRIAPDAIDPRIKSLNYGNNLLGRLEARRNGCDDVIMLDPWGYVAEASAANIFLVNGDTISTPFPKACLDGITRSVVMELARGEGLSVYERDISRTEVLTADEVFLTGTGTELTAVRQVDGSVIGTGGAGPVTTRLLSRYREKALLEGTEF